MLRKDGKRDPFRPLGSNPRADAHVGPLAPLSRWVTETLRYNDAEDARRVAVRKH